MEYLYNFKNSLARELNQNNALQRNLLISILSSRRLLSDHLDYLEEALDDCAKCDTNTSEKVTFAITTGVVATSYVAFTYFQNNFSYAIPCISSALPLLYMRKQINIQQRKGAESILKNLIDAFDEFESGVKKTISFINDAQVMESYARILNRYDRRNQIPFHLVDTIKRVIRAVYCFTKYMEYYYKLDSKLGYLYQEIDDVDNCELMRVYKEEWDIKTIKDFFSLFAYVQSYALLRLGLIAASNIDDGKHLLKMKVNDMTMKIKLQSSRIPSFLDVTQNMQRFQENIKSEITKASPKELRMISSDALDMSVQALSYSMQTFELQVAINEFTKNHEMMTDKKSIDNLLNQLECMENQIALCNGEQHRLTIAIKKYLKKDDEKISDEMSMEAVTPVSAVIKTIKEDDVQQQKDEFFYVDSSTNVEETKNEEAKIEQDINEEDDVRVQLTKKFFKPVLMQLKEKIVPIGEDMKEREKKVLKEKGIEVIEDEKNSSLLNDDNSGSDDERERKIARTRSKFNESRELLMSKQPFNIFGSQPSKPIPIKSSFNGLREEILE